MDLNRENDPVYRVFPKKSRKFNKNSMISINKNINLFSLRSFLASARNWSSDRPLNQKIVKKRV